MFSWMDKIQFGFFHYFTFYHLQLLLRKGNVFTSMCQEFCTRGGRVYLWVQGGVYLWMQGGVCLWVQGGVCLWVQRVYTPVGRHPLGRHPLDRHWADTPQADTPWADISPLAVPIPRDSHCSVRHTSYWNTFLLKILLAFWDLNW